MNVCYSAHLQDHLFGADSPSLLLYSPLFADWQLDLSYLPSYGSQPDKNIIHLFAENILNISQLIINQLYYFSLLTIPLLAILLRLII